MPQIKHSTNKSFFNILSYIVVGTAVAYLICILLFFVFASLSNGLNMNTFATNGTFQLYNPLRRLFEGQIIAKDFPFFHGVGVPLLHYPMFVMLGHNVFAAETTKWLMSGVLFLITTSAFYVAFFRKFKTSVIATALFTVIALYCIDVVYPGNSLMGIRTTFPVLVGAFMLWRPKLIIGFFSKRVSLYWPILYVLIGLSVACGTEQGIAIALAYMLVRLIEHIRSKNPFAKWWKLYVLEGIYLALVIYAILSLLTLGHANEALRYALIDIPRDQGWYFGAPPNSYLDWNTLYYILDERVIKYLAPPILGCAAVAAFAMKKKLLSSKESAVIAMFALYGIIVFIASITGYWAPNAQLIPLARVTGLLLVAMLIKLFLLYRKHQQGHKTTRIISFAVVLVFGIFISWQAVTVATNIRAFPIRQILSNVRLARHSADDAYLGSGWKESVNIFSPYITKGSTIWSTYTSVYDSLNAQLGHSSGGEDYIIHALGPDRRNNYAEDFKNMRPEFTITLRPSYFVYEEWLWSRHWNFYKELFTSYHIVAENGSHLLWARNTTGPQLQESSTQHLGSENGKYTIHIDDNSKAHMYEVRVVYNISKPIPMADKISRYLLGIEGSSSMRFPVSLPPYETSWTFPVASAINDKAITLTPGTYGLFNSGLNVSSMQYKEIVPNNNNMYVLHDNECSFGSDIPSGIYKCTPEQMGLQNFTSSKN